MVMGAGYDWIIKLLIVTWIGFATADILDDVGLDDPLNFFWNRNALLATLNQPCTSTSGPLGTVQGTCRNYADCAFNGGQSYDRGNCNFFETCCVFQRSCGRSSSAKISTFTSPVTVASIPDVCEYRVVLQNPNVCQIRIDFTTNLAQPRSYPATMPPPDPNAGNCIYDYIEIENVEVQNQVKRICGVNNNQHLYVRVGPSDRYLNIRVIVRNRATQPATANLPTPSWNLQMTQLECPGTRAFFTSGNKSQAAADFPRLAPDGCLQYFTDVSGVLKTFNYEGETYMNNLDYASCFRRPAASCGLSLSLGEFRLQPKVTPPPPPTGPAGPTACVDYLYIPVRRPQTSTNPLSPDPAVCDIVLPPPPPPVDWPSISSHPGPLSVYFHSDATIVEKGYSLLYSTANNC